MVNWGHDIALVVISVICASFMPMLGWGYRWRRERKNTRLLVAAEIEYNYSQLNLFLRSLQEASAETRRNMALYLDQAPLAMMPVWQQSRWESLPPRVFTASELAKISKWYFWLQLIASGYERVFSQAAFYRSKWGEYTPEKQHEFVEDVVKRLGILEEITKQTLDEGRPFIDKQFAEAAVYMVVEIKAKQLAMAFESAQQAEKSK